MSTYAFFDTVAAVATPFGKGGVAVIRLSGTDAAAVAARLFRPRSGRALTDYSARVAVWGDILSPDEPGRVLDDGTLFPAPHSFTGEDVAEISCHGGVLVTRSVLDACLRAGARQALPGEFTRRAFLNGRLSLDEAEALRYLRKQEIAAAGLAEGVNLVCARGRALGFAKRIGARVNNMYPNSLRIIKQ